MPNTHSVWVALKSIISEVVRLPGHLRKRNSTASIRESRASGKEVSLEQTDLRGSGFLTLIAYLSYVTLCAVLATIKWVLWWTVDKGSCQSLMDLTCAKGWIQTYCVIFLPLFIAVDLEIHRAYWQVLLPRTLLAQRLIVSIQESSQLQLLDILGDLPYGKFKLRSSAWEEIE